MDGIVVFLVVIGTLIMATGVTLVLDVLAEYCFRPLETSQSLEEQVSRS